MKTILFFALITSVAFAGKGGRSSSGARGTGSNPRSTTVRGTTTKTGKYRAPHTRTAPNKTEADNYETRGNSNPRTGKTGTRTPKK